jgi:hypothetical protein
MFMQLWFRQNKSWLNERLWRINLFCVVRLNFNVKIRDRARLRLNKNAAAGSFMFLLGTGSYEMMKCQKYSDVLPVLIFEVKCCAVPQCVPYLLENVACRRKAYRCLTTRDLEIYLSLPRDLARQG